MPSSSTWRCVTASTVSSTSCTELVADALLEHVARVAVAHAVLDDVVQDAARPRSARPAVARQDDGDVRGMREIGETGALPHLPIMMLRGERERVIDAVGVAADRHRVAEAGGTEGTGLKDTVHRSARTASAGEAVRALIARSGCQHEIEQASAEPCRITAEAGPHASDAPRHSPAEHEQRDAHHHVADVEADVQPRNRSSRVAPARSRSRGDESPSGRAQLDRSPSRGLEAENARASATAGDKPKHPSSAVPRSKLAPAPTGKRNR